MSESPSSIFNRAIHPLYQGGFVFGVFIFFLVLRIALDRLNALDWNKEDIWLYCTSMALFFIIINSIFGFTTKDKNRYYRDSLFTYTGLLIVFILLGKWISGKSVFEAETYSWILLVFSVVFIVFLTIINLVRKIVEIALKQENKIRNEQ